jgi:hypothetical protein
MATILMAFDGRAASLARSKGEETELVYSALSSQPIAQRKAVYRNLSADMKAALWRAHFNHFLQNHPELSEAQRGVLAKALELFSTDTFATSPAGPDWQSNVHEPMLQLEESVRLLFDPLTARQAFAVLGPDTSPVSNEMAADREVSALGARSLPRAPLRATVPDCSCSQGSDWCFFSSCRGSVCYMVTASCGFGWQYDCTAACSN